MRSLSREARHERRVQVIRLRKTGLTYDAIAAQTGLSRTGVFDICKRHEDGGAKALRDAVGGRKLGEFRTLTAEQEREVRRLIRDKNCHHNELASRSPCICIAARRRWHTGASEMSLNSCRSMSGFER